MELDSEPIGTHEQVLYHIGESKPVIFQMNMDQTNEQQCHYNE